jgi:translation initiation factor IF-1
MNSGKAIELEGTIMSVLPGTMFRVAPELTSILVLAHISGGCASVSSALPLATASKLEMSPYDVRQSPHPQAKEADASPVSHCKNVSCLGEKGRASGPLTKQVSSHDFARIPYRTD